VQLLQNILINCLLIWQQTIYSSAFSLQLDLEAIIWKNIIRDWNVCHDNKKTNFVFEKIFSNNNNWAIKRQKSSLVACKCTQ
jgi:hypothetical protein